MTFVISYFVLECGWEPELFWELLEVDQVFVASWICDSMQFGIVQSTFQESWFWTRNCVSSLDIGSRAWAGLSFIISNIARTPWDFASCGCVPLVDLLLCVASQQKTEAGACTSESRVETRSRFCFPNLGIDSGAGLYHHLSHTIHTVTHHLTASACRLPPSSTLMHPFLFIHPVALAWPNTCLPDPQNFGILRRTTSWSPKTNVFTAPKMRLL